MMQRVPREEVDKFRETLSWELDIVKSHHALVELDLPNMADDAPDIEACMQCALQSQTDAQFRGQQFTVDALRRSATE
eukprot:8893056-Pyramimonas_sp.AAC.1